MVWLVVLYGGQKGLGTHLRVASVTRVGGNAKFEMFHASLQVDRGPARPVDVRPARSNDFPHTHRSRGHI